MENSHLKADPFLCNIPVYFKYVDGEYYNNVKLEQRKPVTEEESAITLRYK